MTANIAHTLYINLTSRPDRKSPVEAQLSAIGISPDAYTRFPAVATMNGRIGCSLSHIKCLEIARDHKWKNVLIVEDDIEFLNPGLFQDQLRQFFLSECSHDVLLVAGNNIPPYEKRSEVCVQVSRCQTTTGYLVQEHYYDTLIQNMREGVELLLQFPDKHIKYAVDKWWFSLQLRDTWLLLIPLGVVQREDYSDIEKKTTNYWNLMLDLDKRQFFSKIK
jgi:GR25 family glycosyltransferase involved in LPS biosynthesis